MDGIPRGDVIGVKEREVTKSCTVEETDHHLDIEALKQRYREERDKRVLPQGENQYLQVSDDLATYYEQDPYSPRIEREALDIEVDAVVLGGGFAGLLAAANLRKQGVGNFRIIDMAGDFGGTWYWNRYPAVQCDVDSYCYMPLLEETGYIPTEKYAHGPEIYAHCQRIGRHFDLYSNALFHTMVRSLIWDDSISRWRVDTDRGDNIRTRFVIMASGPFNRPKLPGIPGIKDFKGHSFHTARWDYDYTGGDPENPELTGLADKRVAIIGTGATGLQCIPPVARHAKHLYAIQRTPAAVDIRGNRPTDDAFRQSLKPGWQRERQANFHNAAFYGIEPGQADLVCDGWTELGRRVAYRMEEEKRDFTLEERLALREEEDFGMMERIRRRVDSIVANPEVADKLKAYYRMGCKRPSFSDDYLPTFNRSNVTLVDVSDSRGVERITPTGFIANGVEYPVDCIIFASGFEITTSIERRFGIGAIEGRGGASLYDHWRDGFRTYHGMMAHGFPNQFFTGFIQGGVSANISEMYDHQTEHAAYIIAEALKRGYSRVEPSQQSEDDWVTMMHETMISNEAFFRECTPGYYNNEGGKVFRSYTGEVYAPGYAAFLKLMEEWRREGNLEGMEVS